MELEALLTLNTNQKLFANPKRMALLEQIGVCGSISQGAKLAGLSYRAAWNAINDMNQVSPQPVVVSETGGKGGGGAALTEFGGRLIKVYRLMHQMQTMVMQALMDTSVTTESLLDVMSHFTLKTSARNQLKGQVVAIEPRDVKDKIIVKLESGSEIAAIITRVSTEQLQLTPEKEVLLLFKAPSVTISTEPVTPKERGEKNQLAGQLVHLTQGEESSEVFLDIGQGQLLYASVSHPALQGLVLQLDQHYYATFDPNQILVTCI
ncbi:TOBE domain-containing protein [Vibrio aphrogenes]|uniref:TOBE domain-containing protein n=1 Tax=Vibrio aphrogenes TaxID=1891186 RepID=UPI000B35C459|nr:TOBE domain-containing protein [Vibrio aphrogenes]